VAVDSVWSEEKVAELRRLWIDEKLSGAQIATALGLKDRNAVMGKIHRLGITRKTAEARGDEPAVVASRQSPPAAAPADAALPDAIAAAGDEVVAAAPEAPAPSPQPPAEVPSAEPEEDTFSGHPIMQLKESSCRWPIGDPMAAGFRFCCKPKAGPLPYCSEHAQMSYLPSESRTRRPLPPKAA
jgi:GcrA cell cycle regulator